MQLLPIFRVRLCYIFIKYQFLFFAGDLPDKRNRLNLRSPNKIFFVLNLSFRENHDQEKPPLNSLTDNTVAMEVT